MVKQMVKVIHRVENITGYYRNYYSFRTVVKIIVVLRVITEITMTFSSYFIHEVYTSKMFNNILNIHTIIMMIIPLCTTNNYKTLLSKLNCLDVFNFLTNQYSSNKLNARKRALMLFVTAYISLVVIIDSIYYFIFWETLISEVENPLLFGLFELVFNLGYYRHLCQYSVIYCYLSLLTELIDCITRSVDEEVTLRVRPRSDDGTLSSVQTELPLFDKWSAAYTAAANISKLCNIVFGFQISVMLAMFIYFCIEKFYIITRTNVLGKTLSLLHYQIIFVISVMEYQISLYLLSRAGQGLVNSAASLRRRLTFLLLLSCECEAQYKAIRNILRQMLTHPIQTKAFGSIDVNMALVPVCLSFSISNAVIALQYNKVV